MTAITQTCRDCKHSFVITEEDQAFYAKMDVLMPSSCPACRSQQRMSWRNERNLYHRKCDLCAKAIISTYHSESPYTVYCQTCFWGDGWNALDFGRDIEWHRPMFEQIQDLQLKVPRLAIVNKESQNSDYCNYSFANKNSYLCFGSHYEQDCLYSEYSTQNLNCVDSTCMYKSTSCYECLYSKNCTRSVYLDHCETSRECYFSIDLKDCEHCLFSANLRHKKYYIFNQAYSKEEYFKKLAEYRLSDYTGFQHALRYFSTDFRFQFPRQANHQTNCENCEGSTHSNSKNLRFCFDSTDCEDCAYGSQMDRTKNSMDTDFMGYDPCELSHQSIGCAGTYNCLSCESCWHDSDLAYCQLCFSSKDCFASIGLRQKQYCILNKEYSKIDYENLKLRLIEKMKQRGEWGEFFPSELSPFAYNQTMAATHFPLSKEAATAQGFRWFDDEGQDYQGPVVTLPDSLSDIPKDITQKILRCEVSGKLYKITPHELEFYLDMKIPLPRRCPEQRYNDRVKRCCPRKFWDRACGECGISIQTTYSPDRPEKVLCEECYLKTVY